MQIYFLSLRVAQQTEVEKIVRSGRSVIHDRSIYEDLYIFSTHQHRLGFMTDLQFETYQRLFMAVQEHLHPPDLVVYLHATTDRLLEQIARRGRTYEQSIDTGYLREINELYESWLRQLENGIASIKAPFLPVDVCRTDLLQESVFEEFCQIFQDRLERMRN